MNDSVFFLLKEWIQPVCLPPANFNIENITKESELAVTGWSFSKNGNTNGKVISVSVSLLDIQQCNRTFNGILGTGTGQVRLISNVSDVQGGIPMTIQDM